MLLLLLLFKAWDNIKLRCFKIITEKLYHVMPYKPDVARLSTIHSPPNSCTRYTWCLISLAIWGSCAGCMWYSASGLVCPLVCSLQYPVALYKLHVMSYSQLSCLPSGLSTPLSSCLLPRLWLPPVRQERKFSLNEHLHLHVIKLDNHNSACR